MSIFDILYGIDLLNSLNLTYPFLFDKRKYYNDNSYYKLNPVTYSNYARTSFTPSYIQFGLAFPSTWGRALTNKGGNNIRFGGDFSNYNQWHADNIIKNWHNSLLENKNKKWFDEFDFETNIRNSLESWNHAGGFEWLNTDDKTRALRMVSEELEGKERKGAVEKHLQYILDNFPLLNQVIGSQSSSYIFPKNPNTGDRYNSSAEGYYSGTDNDFGILTGNRRPTIHIKTDNDTFKWWSDFYKNLGYIGAYKYLDHWVPTKDASRVEIPFDLGISEQEEEKPYESFLKPVDISSMILNPSKNPKGGLNVLLVVKDEQGVIDFNGSPVGIGGTPVGKDEKTPWYKKINWLGLGQNIQKMAPNILEDIRLAGNLYNNERVYKASLEGIRPNLMLTYLTHRQVVGDEATKLAYYRRGAEGVTRASLAFTSDADRLMAYLMEAQRQANELRAQGDLADNQEIRRTSDESNQHQWANTQRRAEVANQNTAQINAANQAKLNLLAQKYSANWTSWENYLRGREYRWRLKLAEAKSLDDLIWQLGRLNKLENDPELLKYLQELQIAIKKPENLTDGVVDYSSDEIRNILKKIRDREYQLRLETLQELLTRNSGIFAKSGTKITYKKKDDLLYKAARDAVEHFRAMTKLTDDSYQKSRKRVPKLVPHPRKYLQGGVAPFTVFTPIAMGGEQSVATTTSGAGTTKSSATSTKDDSGKEMLTLVKDLFSKMEGLPIDISKVYAPIMSLMERVKYGGKELSTQEIATIYLLSMNLLSRLKHNLNIYNEAKKEALANDALNEFVITDGGKILSLNVDDGSFKALSWDELKEAKGKYNPLTNNTLLELRAHSPNLAFNANILEYVTGTIGINKVTEEINKLASNIKSTELESQGFSKKESGLIAKGLELLLNPELRAAELLNAPEGTYQYTLTIKDLKAQMLAALKYISLVLPTNMLNTLKVYADMNGVKPIDIIANGLSSRMDYTLKTLWKPMTGKAAIESNGGVDVDADKINTNPLIAMLRQLGGIPTSYQIITRDSNTRMSVDGTYYSALPKVEEDMSIDRMLSVSELDGILDKGGKYGITFGDLQVKPEDLRHIMYSNVGGAIVTLPCKIVNGAKQVNLAIKDLYEEALKEAKAEAGGNPERYEQILGLKLHEKHLDSLLKSNGYPNKEMFGLFLVVEAYTTDRIPLENKNSQYIEKVRNPDSNLELRLSLALSTDNKKSDYSVDIKDKFIFELGYDDIYRGTVFIPINNNPNSAMMSWGNSTLKMDLQQDLEQLYQISNKALRYNRDTLLEQ